MKPIKVTFKLCLLVSILVNAFFRLWDYIRDSANRNQRRSAPRRRKPATKK